MSQWIDLSAKAVNDFSLGKGNYQGEMLRVSKNLYLRRSLTGIGKYECYWVFRVQKPLPYKYQFANYHAMTLAKARVKVEEFLEALRHGHDPREEIKNKALDRVRQENEKNRQAITFGEVAKRWFDEQVKNKKWKHDPTGESHVETNLRLHIMPAVKEVPIHNFSWQDVYTVMLHGDLYTNKPSAARKCRAIINQVCAYANSEGLTNIPNPAVVTGALAYKLNQLDVKASAENQPALPYAQIPAFFEHLRSVNTIGARALEFAILTASRQGQIIKSIRHGKIYGAKWSDFDLDKGIWYVPSEIVKVKVPFQCFLSSYAIKLLKQLPRFKDCPWVFTVNGIDPISNGCMLQTIHRMNEKRRKERKPLWVDPDLKDQYGEARQITAHGTARSSFKTWASSDSHDNYTRFSEKAVELCLTHQIQDGYNGAYDRSKHAKTRRELMEAWGRYCYTGKYPDQA